MTERQGSAAGAGQWRGLSAALLLALVFAMAMATLLNYFKFRNALAELARDNVAVAAQDIEESVRLAQSLGLPLTAMSSLPALLQRQAAIDPAIRVIRIADPAGTVVFSSLAASAANMPAEWLRAAGRARDGHWQGASDSGAVVGRVLKNDFNLPVALLAIEYSTADIEAGAAALRPQVLGEALSCLAGGALAGLLLIVALLRRPRPAWLPTALILTVTAATLLAFAWRSVPYFERHLVPELQQKARLIGAVEAALIGKALAHGLALPELVGVEDALRQDLQQNPGLAALAVADAGGRELFRAPAQAAAGEALRVPLNARDGGNVGSVGVWLDPDFARRLVRELALDLAVVLVVALFLTLELLAALAPPAKPGGDPLAACRDVRAPAFVFFLAEETTRAFLPAFAAELADGVAFLSPALLAGLPISLFMLIVALSQPRLGALCQRYGQRRLLSFGAATAVLGFVLCAAAPGLGVFLLGRAIGACGYAAVFVAAQNYVLERTDTARRSAGFALFVGAIMVATVCGPSVGGVVADHLGARAGFLLAAVLAALALPLIRRLDEAAPVAGAETAVASLAWRRLLANRRFLALCFAAAVPAKILLTAGCFYLLPLYVLDAGGSQAEAGRLLMLYAVCMVLLMPLTAGLADRGDRRSAFVCGGLLLSAAGGLAAMFGFTAAVAPLLVLGLGLGQALSIAAQSTLVATLAVEECAALGSGVVYGVYRLLERSGNTLGPLLAAALLTGFGFRVAFACLGALALLAALVFYLLVLRPLRPRAGAAECA